MNGLAFLLIFDDFGQVKGGIEIANLVNLDEEDLCHTQKIKITGSCIFLWC